MRSGLNIELDADGIDDLVRQFEATPAQLEAAMRSTYGRMGRWLRTQAVRGLSQKLGIQQKILRSRVRAFRMQGGIASARVGSKVWFGLNPIPLSRLRPRKAPKGVRAQGGRYVEGAFLANIRGRQQVMRRTGPARLPLEVVYADIEDPSQVYIEDVLIGSDAFEAQFLRTLEHEIKWRTRTLG